MSSPQEKNDTGATLDGEVLPPLAAAETKASPDADQPLPETARAFLDGGGEGTLPLPAPAHRPSTYNQDIADRFIDAVATTTDNVSEILKQPGMPSFSTVMRWRRTFPEFGDAYVEAMRFRAECMSDDLLRVADDLGVGVDQKDRMIDTRKWLLRKKIPLVFGDPGPVINGDAALAPPQHIANGDGAKVVQGSHVLSADPFANAMKAFEASLGKVTPTEPPKS